MTPREKEDTYKMVIDTINESKATILAQLGLRIYEDGEQVDEHAIGNETNAGMKELTGFTVDEIRMYCIYHLSRDNPVVTLMLSTLPTAVSAEIVKMILGAFFHGAMVAVAKNQRDAILHRSN